MTTEQDYFKGMVRSVTPEDRLKLPRLSYSGLELFKTCPYEFDLKYNKGMRTNETTLPLELGGLLHKVLEERVKSIIIDEPINYDYLDSILKKGFVEQTEKTREHLLGIEELKRKYFEEWYAPDNASGMNYEEKMKVFQKAMMHEMEDCSNWRPVYTELPFEFVYKDRVIFNGFIDRIDLDNSGNFRTTDYKSSKAVFKKEKIVTSLQFGIYALAIYHMFGKLPIEHLYRFILIDEDQKAMTKGWERRLESALEALLTKIDKVRSTGVAIPNPSALCFFCSYAATNPKAKEYKNECPYYCLWTPENRRFDVNRRYNVLDNSGGKIDNGIKKRKLIF